MEVQKVDKNELSEFVKIYNDVLISSHEDKNDLLNYASKLLHSKNISQAKDIFLFYTNNSPNSISAHLGLAFTFWFLGQYDLFYKHSEIVMDLAKKSGGFKNFPELPQLSILVKNTDQIIAIKSEKEQKNLKLEKQNRSIENKKEILDTEMREAFKAKNRQTKIAKDLQLLDISQKLFYRTKKEGDDWRRGKFGSNYPTKDCLKEDASVDYYFFKNLVPEKPIITRDKNILTLGSCFAGYIKDYLNEKFYKLQNDNSSQSKAHIFSFTDGIVNTYTLLQQFEWAFGNADFSQPLWFDNENVPVEYTEIARKSTECIFKDVDVFIITLGLSEVLYHKKTDEVLMRFLPSEHFRSDQHAFRVASVDENLINLEKIYGYIRSQNKESIIIFTLSPVPLARSFRHISGIAADTVSKSILRVAVDEITRCHADDANLFYFPAYELVKSFLKDPYDDDNRHVSKEAIEYIMAKFAKFYLS